MKGRGPRSGRRARAGRQEVGPPSRTARLRTARITAARPDNSRGGPTMANPTRWVGIDLHRQHSQIAIIDEHSELTLSKRVPTRRETVSELLGDPENTHVAL